MLCRCAVSCFQYCLILHHRHFYRYQRFLREILTDTCRDAISDGILRLFARHDNDIALIYDSNGFDRHQLRISRTDADAV